MIAEWKVVTKDILRMRMAHMITAPRINFSDMVANHVLETCTFHHRQRHSLGLGQNTQGDAGCNQAQKCWALFFSFQHDKRFPQHFSKSAISYLRIATIPVIINHTQKRVRGTVVHIRRARFWVCELPFGIWGRWTSRRTFSWVVRAEWCNIVIENRIKSNSLFKIIFNLEFRFWFDPTFYDSNLKLG